MQALILPILGLIVEGCCWYNVFRCCGCIEDGTRHVEIDKQPPSPKEPNPFHPPPPTGNPKYVPNPNPFQS